MRSSDRQKYAPAEKEKQTHNERAPRNFPFRIVGTRLIGYLLFAYLLLLNIASRIWFGIRLEYSRAYIPFG